MASFLHIARVRNLAAAIAFGGVVELAKRLGLGYQPYTGSDPQFTSRPIPIPPPPLKIRNIPILGSLLTVHRMTIACIWHVRWTLVQSPFMLVLCIFLFTRRVTLKINSRSKKKTEFGIYYV